MRSVYTAFVLVFSLVLIGGGCASSQTTPASAPEQVKVEIPEDYQEYSDESGWSVSHPADWTVQKMQQEGITQTFLRSPILEGSAFNSNVGIMSTETPFKASDVVLADIIPDIEGALITTGATELSVNIVNLPAGEAIKAEGVLTQDDASIYMTQIQIYKDNVTYVITGLVHENDQSGFGGAIENIIASFDSGL